MECQEKAPMQVDQTGDALSTAWPVSLDTAKALRVWWHGVLCCCWRHWRWLTCSQPRTMRVLMVWGWALTKAWACIDSGPWLQSLMWMGASLWMICHRFRGLQSYPFAWRQEYKGNRLDYHSYISSKSSSDSLSLLPQLVSEVSLFMSSQPCKSSSSKVISGLTNS